jgi:hypothetical protein
VGFREPEISGESMVLWSSGGWRIQKIRGSGRFRGLEIEMFVGIHGNLGGSDWGKLGKNE